nr:MAG TPA: hypothetical protein [Caudoviricetes sp.]
MDFQGSLTVFEYQTFHSLFIAINVLWNQLQR